MRVRAFAPVALAAFLAACSSPAATAQPGSTSGAPAASGPAPTAPVTTAGAAIDLSKLDVCAIVPETTVAALTGETDFRTDDRAQRDLASCFWGVPKAGVPQYLEVTVQTRTKPLGDYVLTVNNVPCLGAAIPGVGTEARGGTCPNSQNKVWLIVLDRGVSVQVIVNEPKGTLTPSDLVAVVNGVLAGLG